MSPNKLQECQVNYKKMTPGWGGSPGIKVPGCNHEESNSMPRTYIISWGWGHLSAIPELRGRGQGQAEIPGACWPDSLAEISRLQIQ